MERKRLTKKEEKKIGQYLDKNCEKLVHFGKKIIITGTEWKKQQRRENCYRKMEKHTKNCAGEFSNKNSWSRFQ